MDKKFYIAVCVCVLAPQLMRAQFSNGDGTFESPFQINTAEQLVQLAEEVNSGNNCSSLHFILTADIDLATYGFDWKDGKGWIPIGHSDKARFQGNFNGAGCKISNIFINREEYDSYSGLFGYVFEGTIQNLEIVNANITGNKNVGGVAGCINGTVTTTYDSEGVVGIVRNGGNITNCNVAGEVSGKSFVGGVVGHVGLSSVITDCYSSCTVNGEDHVGGIVGDVRESEGNGIINCNVAGEVRGKNLVGGVAGQVGFSSIITDCYSSCTVNGEDHVGGIVGDVCEGGGNGIINCYAIGAISGYMQVGGIAGSVNSGNIVTCYVTSMVNGVSSVGGMAGKVTNSSIENCFTSSNVYGSNFSIGGVAGDIWNGSSITNCYVTGSIRGSDHVGGVVGHAVGSFIPELRVSISNCVALNDSITAWSVESKAGRIVGLCSIGMSNNTGTFENNCANNSMIVTICPGTIITTSNGWHRSLEMAIKSPLAIGADKEDGVDCGATPDEDWWTTNMSMWNWDSFWTVTKGSHPKLKVFQ